MTRELPALTALCVLAACSGEEEPEPAAPASTSGDGFSPLEAPDLDPDPGVVRVALRAARHEHLVDGVVHSGYAYNEQLPGPTIRAKIGDRLVVELENALEQATTIHWHGLRVPYEMDGVTWQQQPIDAGASFTYDFALEQAGTFWYHPHFDSAGQVDGGLYGALVVEDPAEPRAGRELVAVLDVLGEPGSPGGGGHGHERSRAEDGGHTGAPAPGATAWIVNGRSQPVVAIAGGEHARVRLVNASNQGYLDLAGAPLRQIASDQGLLPALDEPERLLLAPGDRAELEWPIGESALALTSRPYSLAGASSLGEESHLFHVEPARPAAPPAPLAWPFGGEAPSPDPGTTDILYVLTGSDHGDWRINGEAFPDVTVQELALGAEAVIELRNVSGTEHPFHLHGHFFEVLSVNGTPPPTRRLEDTVNLAVHDVVRLRLVADNPGEWMAHCHILSHADGGMMTVLRVTE